VRLQDKTFDEVSLISVTYNRVFIIHEGQGKIIIDHKGFDIKGSKIFIVSKRQIFSFSSQTKLSGFQISFGNCFWDKTPASASNCKLLLFNDAALHQNIPLKLTEPMQPEISSKVTEFQKINYSWFGTRSLFTPPSESRNIKKMKWP